MAVRYSGKAVVTIGWDHRSRTYRGRVTDDRLVYRGHVPQVGFLPRDPTSSSAYDDAARRLMEAAQRNARARKRRFEFKEENGRILVRRTFESPCPS